MRPSQLLHLWLLFIICGANRLQSKAEEDEEFSSDSRLRHQGKLSLPFHQQMDPANIPDFPGDQLADLPTESLVERSLDASPKRRSVGSQQQKNCSSRVRTGRKKGRKSNQSITMQPGSTRRKLERNFRVLQKSRYKIKSKDLDFLPGFGKIAQKSCPMKYNWLTPKTAVNIDNDLVDVYQPGTHTLEGLENWSQMFYTESCINYAGQRDCPGCCRGIDHSVYSSSCKQRLSYVQALVALPGSPDFFWSHIKVNSSCVCEFSLDLP